MCSDILFWNANGLTSRFSDLESLLTQPQADHRIAAVAIVESKLDHDSRDRPPSIDGYVCTSIPFTKHSGGILFLVRNEMPSRHLAAYDYTHRNSPTAVSCMLIQLPTSSKPTLLVAVYIHPQTTTNTLTSVLSHMSTVVQHHNSHDIIITGDFNSRHPAWGDITITRTAPPYNQLPLRLQPDNTQSNIYPTRPNEAVIRNSHRPHYHE